ncbi:MAG: redoxin domain-containing protein, partial [Patescibacteria group bacterium]
KVVIVDFWTYTCINCQRTFPYLKEWWKKYKESGLVIIGVHAPEFEFEKDKTNLAKAIADFGLTYPIVQDNDFSTWRAYDNQYWPAKYIIDKDGIIRYTHFGEGGYDETEKMIQELLKETGAKGLPSQIQNINPQTFGKTPETYLGYSRIAHFSSPEAIQAGSFSSYSVPNVLPVNTFALKGRWKIQQYYATPQKGSELMFHFDAKEVFLVMKAPGQIAKVKVYLDGKMQYFGEHNDRGVVTVNSDKLYKLVLLPSPGRHLLKLKFEDANAQLFAFTFG